MYPETKTSVWQSDVIDNTRSENLDKNAAHVSDDSLMAIFNPTDATSCSLPLFYAMKTFGLLSMTANRTGKRVRYEVSKFGRLHTLIVAVLLTAASVLHWMNVMKLEEFARSTIFGRGMLFLQIWSQMLLVLTAMLKAQRQGDAIAFMEKLHEIDVTLRQAFIEIPHKKHQRYTIIVLVVLIAVICLAMVGDALLHPEPDPLKYFLFFASTCIPRIMISIYICYVLAGVRAVGQRLRLVNRHFVAQGERNMDVECLRAAASVHATVCDVAKMFSDTYSLPLLINFIMCFFFILTYMSTSITHLRMMQPMVNVVIPMFFVVWYTVTTMFVCKACQETVDESEASGKILHTILRDSSDGFVKKESIFFSLQVCQTTAGFYAAGFFRVDLDLAYSMVGALSTYIFILKQVE